MYPASRSLPFCAPINRDHAREHERKSDFCFEVGNETRNPRRRGHVPINCCGVACAQVTKQPTHKPGYVNSPADAFGICHPTQPTVFYFSKSVNFRAGVPQFGRPRCASDWPRPPFCATGARSRHPHPACAQFRFAASLASPNHLPAPASSRLPPLSAVS